MIHVEHHYRSAAGYAACLRLLWAETYWLIDKKIDVAAFHTALFRR